MTLCAGVKVPCTEMNPARYVLDFVPGIVIFADSRFTDLTSSWRIEDGLKVGRLSDYAVVAFGGHVEPAHEAFAEVQATLRASAGTVTPHHQMARQIQQALRKAFQRWRARHGRETSPTDVILGVRVQRRQAVRYAMFQLSWADNFTPHPRDGLIRVGVDAGKAEFDRRFSEEIRAQSHGWIERQRDQLRPRPPGFAPPSPQDQLVPLIDAAAAVSITLNEIVEIMVHPVVGGLLQGMILHSSEVRRVHGVTSKDSGESWQRYTADKLRHFQQIFPPGPRRS